ncbi:hypothetical protein Tco_1104110 [Tanacetum coccineum]
MRSGTSLRDLLQKAWDKRQQSRFYCQEAYWFEKPVKTGDLGARKFSTKVSSTELQSSDSEGQGLRKRERRLEISIPQGSRKARKQKSRNLERA